MTLDGVLRWIHLLAAAVWVGGLITLGALVAAVRRAGAERTILQAMARRFGVVSWTAMAISVITGLWQVDRLGYRFTDEPLVRKLGLVAVAIGLAATHQFTARRSSPALRGVLQGLILLVSIGIFAAAVAL